MYNVIKLDVKNDGKEDFESISVLSDVSTGEIKSVSEMKWLVSELSRSIKVLDNESMKEEIENHNLERVLLQVSHYKYKSKYPLDFLHLKRIKMIPSNMRKTTRPYICIACGKKFLLNRNDYKLAINAYVGDWNYSVSKFIDFDNIKKSSGACCSEECLANIAKYISMESVTPLLKKFLEPEYLEMDIIKHINELKN